MPTTPRRWRGQHEGQIGIGEAWEVEHVIAYALTRDNSDGNLRPAHVKCHRAKTDVDVAAIAQAKRREAKHQGVERPAGKLRGPAFVKPDKPAREAKPLPPRRPLFTARTAP
jgi:5-methylcytosine-specific restriction protein A